MDNVALQSKKKHPDNTNLNTGYLPNFSGNWNNGTNAGTFYLNVNYSTSNANSNLGTHQMFYRSNGVKPCLGLAGAGF